IKTDMDVGRLPSGKFETNELVLELTILAYNILRMIGQESIGRKGTGTKHKVRRRRLRTVIGNMVMMASHVTEHARQLLIGLGRSNIWRHAFAEVDTAFADFQLKYSSYHTTI
ncbi:MAG: IS1380 family transposase, partial [Lachnospiraceae bacterium]|nr:IS1380 family transposase [Lachnospiraceae bacterium]